MVRTFFVFTTLIGILFAPPTLISQETELGNPSLLLLWTRAGDLNGEAGAVESAEFGPEGKTIVSGSKYDNRVVMWRTDDGHRLWAQEVSDEVERAAYAPTGEYVVSTGEDEALTLWRAEDGSFVKRVKLDAPVDGMEFSPMGDILVTGKEGGRVQKWSFPEMELLASVEHGDTVNTVTFSRDGSVVYTGGTDEPATVKAWRTRDMSLLKTYRVPEPGAGVISVRLSPDGKFVAAGLQLGWLGVWEVESGELVRCWNVNGRKVEAVDWSPDGHYLVHAGIDPYIYIVRFSDLYNVRVPFIFRVTAGNTEYLDFSPNGAFLTSGHEDGMVRLWMWRSGDPDVHIKHHRRLQQDQKKRAEERRARDGTDSDDRL